MKPEEIEKLRTKAASGEVITQQEAHDMLAEILRLREALTDIRAMHADNPSDAMANTPEADYARHILVQARLRARRALEGESS